MIRREGGRIDGERSGDARQRRRPARGRPSPSRRRRAQRRPRRGDGNGLGGARAAASPGCATPSASGAAITFSNLPESLQTIARLYGVHDSPAAPLNAIEVRDVEKRYGTAASLARSTGVSLRGRGGRVLRPARAERRRQDHADQRRRRPGARRRRPGRASWAPTWSPTTGARAACSAWCRRSWCSIRSSPCARRCASSPATSASATTTRWIDEVMHHLDLTAKADVNMRALSGGMKRRVLVAQALVHKPPVIVLDEPTAGVDVELRQGLWQFVRAAQPRRPHHRAHHPLPGGGRGALQPHRHAQGRADRRARLDAQPAGALRRLAHDCARGRARRRASSRSSSRATPTSSRSSRRLRAGGRRDRGPRAGAARTSSRCSCASLAKNAA